MGKNRNQVIQGLVCFSIWRANFPSELKLVAETPLDSLFKCSLSLFLGLFVSCLPSRRRASKLSATLLFGQAFSVRRLLWLWRRRDCNYRIRG